MRVDAARGSFSSSGDQDIFRPSCDALLASVAETAARSRRRDLDRDGQRRVARMKKIKEAGGVTLARMKDLISGCWPSSGCVDRILPLEEIATEIVRAALGGRAGGAMTLVPSNLVGSIRPRLRKRREALAEGSGRLSKRD
jgi:chemotaxis response regulator CheB